jgi:hypothetical protein
MDWPACMERACARVGRSTSHRTVVHPLFCAFEPEIATRATAWLAARHARLLATANGLRLD